MKHKNKTYNIKVLTLFPEMFPGSLGYSLAAKARENKVWDMDVVNIRNYADDRYGTVDDVPYGGGSGMILKADVLGRAFDANIPRKDCAKIVLTPRGKPLTQDKIKKISSQEGLLIVCARYEGFDERFVESRSLEEISIGDYVLSGGEPAAIVLIDSVVRLLSGTLKNSSKLCEESFNNKLLEYPQYTRPLNWEGMTPPEVLLSGNHEEIKKWRLNKSKEDTKSRRPELVIDEKK